MALPVIALQVGLWGGMPLPSLPPAARYDGLIALHARRTGLDPRLVKAVVAVESDFRPGAVSASGARGLMQVLPATAEELGVPARELARPGAGLEARTSYLASLFRAARGHYGLAASRLQDAPPWAQRRVLAAYHDGPRLLFGGPLPAATLLYVRRVRFYARSPASSLSTRP